MSRHVYRITLADERPVSLNAYYAGGHWGKRTEEAARVHALVQSQLPGVEAQLALFEDGAAWPFAITFTAYLRGRMLDCDNLAAKLYIDGFKHSILLPDDTGKYIDSVTLKARRDNECPRVVIDFYSGE